MDSAEIYASTRHVAYLVASPELEASLLVSQRGEPGEYELQRGDMAFEIGRKTARLKPAPPLLGHQTGVSLGERSPKLAAKANAYKMKSFFGPTTLQAEEQRDPRACASSTTACPSP